MTITYAIETEPVKTDPEMIKVYPDCEACRGTGQRYNEDEGADYPCRKCDGEGWIAVEVCEACLQDETGCKCLDEADDGLSEMERLGEGRYFG
jgi:hypothetical protein